MLSLCQNTQNDNKQKILWFQCRSNDIWKIWVGSNDEAKFIFEQGYCESSSAIAILLWMTSCSQSSSCKLRKFQSDGLKFYKSTYQRFRYTFVKHWWIISILTAIAGLICQVLRHLILNQNFAFFNFLFQHHINVKTYRYNLGKRGSFKWERRFFYLSKKTV